MLFATLDTSVRQIRLEDNKHFLLSDTVGFVSKLPHHLVKAFRSTLEEARNSDLLLHVVDVSNEEYRHMIDVTNTTLLEVGVENVPTVFVYNKADLAGIPYPKVGRNELWISAKEGKGLDELLEMIKGAIFSNHVTCRMLVPFERGDIVAYLNDSATILETEYEEEGTVMKVELGKVDYDRFEQFVIGK